MTTRKLISEIVAGIAFMIFLAIVLIFGNVMITPMPGEAFDQWAAHAEGKARP